jgi:hypothetical protein
VTESYADTFPATFPTKTRDLPRLATLATTGEACTLAPVFCCQATPRVLAFEVETNVSGDTPVWV